jgi:purine-binding chemotaxis protein CheW
MFEDEVLTDEADVEEDTSSTFLTFDLGGQTLGVGVQFVREIIDAQKITPLPNAPSEILGVVDVRGQSVPIIELGQRLGVPSCGFPDEARMVVLEIGARGSMRQLAIRADQVRKVDQIPACEIEAIPTDGFDHWDARMLLGLSRREDALVALIDLQAVFGDGTDQIDLSADSGFF